MRTVAGYGSRPHLTGLIDEAGRRGSSLTRDLEFQPMDYDPDVAADTLLARREAIADRVVAAEFAARPELDERYGPTGRLKCQGDAVRHVQYLAEAVRLQRPRLFEDYVAWAAVLLARLGIPGEELDTNLGYFADAVAEEGGAGVEAMVEVIGQARADLDAPTEEASYLTDSAPNGALARAYLDALLDSDRVRAHALVEDALEAGVSVRELYLDVFQATQYEVGRLWHAGEIGVAEEHYVSAATQVIMSGLYPRIFTTPTKGLRMIAACVGEDLHEMGIRMVADFFEMDGWNTIYIGANAPKEALVAAVRRHAPHLLALSTTMTFHLGHLTETIEAVRAVDRNVRILVGGFPFRSDGELWRSVGADGWARDAQEAIEKAETLVGSGT